MKRRIKIILVLFIGMSSSIRPMDKEKIDREKFENQLDDVIKKDQIEKFKEIIKNPDFDPNGGIGDFLIFRYLVWNDRVDLLKCLLAHPRFDRDGVVQIKPHPKCQNPTPYTKKEEIFWLACSWGSMKVLKSSLDDFSIDLAKRLGQHRAPFVEGFLSAALFHREEVLEVILADNRACRLLMVNVCKKGIRYSKVKVSNGPLGIAQRNGFTSQQKIKQIINNFMTKTLLFGKRTKYAGKKD